MVTIPTQRWEWHWDSRGWRGKEEPFSAILFSTFSILYVFKKVKLKT